MTACLALILPIAGCASTDAQPVGSTPTAMFTAATDAPTVHDLIKEPTVPPQYGDFLFGTFDVDRSQISADDGFTFADGKWTPKRKGAVLTVRHVGKWKDNTGAEQWINARFTVNDWRRAYFNTVNGSKGLGVTAGEWKDGSSDRSFMDMTIDFLLDDGTSPQGFRGVTGFVDLDGVSSMPDEPIEGWELLSGFDGVWKRSDAHLKAFGANGWAGYLDDSPNDNDTSHRKYHYMAVTFTGATLHARYSVAPNWGFGSYFMPIPATTAFRLFYDANGGTGVNGGSGLPDQTN